MNKFTLRYHPTDYTDICNSGTYVDIYSNCSPLGYNCNLFDDPDGNSLAPNGFYSDGTQVYHWYHFNIVEVFSQPCAQSGGAPVLQLPSDYVMGTPLVYDPVFGLPSFEYIQFYNPNTQIIPEYNFQYQPPAEAQPVIPDPVWEAPVEQAPLYYMNVFEQPVYDVPVYNVPPAYVAPPQIDYAALEAERAAAEAQRLKELADAAAALAAAEQAAANLRAQQLQSLQDEIARQQAAEAAAEAARLENERIQEQMRQALLRSQQEQAAAEAAYQQMIQNNQAAEAEQARLAAQAAADAAAYQQNLLQAQQLEAARADAASAAALQQQKQDIAAAAEADRQRMEQDRLQAEANVQAANQVLQTMQAPVSDAGVISAAVEEQPSIKTATANSEVQRTDAAAIPSTVPAKKVGSNLKPFVLGFGIIALTLLVAKALTSKKSQ